MQTLWDYRYAQRTQRMKSSAIRELLKLTEQPEIISFAGGLPAPDVFPVQEFQEACNRVLRDFGPVALQYGTTEGYLPLREMIARHHHALRYRCFRGQYPDHFRFAAGAGFAGENLYQPRRPHCR